MAATVGADGRIYLKYGAGMKFNVEAYDTLVEFVILDCFYDEKSDKEIYILAEDGEEDGIRQTLEQLEFLMAFGSTYIHEDGSRVEYPLTVDEVTAYFKHVRNLKNKAYREAQEALSKIEEYNILTASQAEIERQLAPLQVKRMRNYGVDLTRIECEEYEVLTVRYRDVCAKRKVLIEENGFSLRLFRQSNLCPACNNTGVTEDGICFCAYALTEEIKSYNAVVRKEKQLSAGWTKQFEAFTVSDEEE